MNDNSSHIEVKRIKEIKFGLLSSNDIRRMSVITDNVNGIVIPETRENLNPKKGGLSDLRLGTIDQHFKCQTCGLDSIKCPGHFGHITLAKPVFHISYMQYIVNVLNCVCIRCSKLLLDRNAKTEKELQYIIKTSTTPKQQFIRVKNLLKNTKYCNKENHGCGAPRPKLRKEDKPRIDIIAEYQMVKNSDEVADEEYSDKVIKKVLTPEYIYSVLKNISNEDYKILGFNPEISRLEDMIIQILPVSPIAIRPSVINRADNTVSDDDITHKFADIVKTNLRYNKHLETFYPANPESDLDKSLNWVLQYHVATLIDNEIIGTPTAIQRNGKPIKSITSRLRHKEGRIRGHLMGKRVNFSARTVITPDPNIGIQELGVPVRIAITLTIPIIVTEYNLVELTETVKNGRTYPGANFVILKNRNNIKIDLRYGKLLTLNLSIGDIVERHMIDGDVILFNRQPSLHKYSMMAHKVRINRNPNHLTFRMNVCVTPPYNADFDGDEMNLHVPQTIQTRTELLRLVLIPQQIISVAKSSPSIGMVMDPLLGSWLLTNFDNKLSKYDCMNILMYTTVNKSKLKLTKEFYTGSELFSYILPQNMSIKLGHPDNPSFVVKNGKIVKGVLNKKLVGPKGNSLIHIIWNDYGPMVCTDFINNTQRLINTWLLYYNSFSVGLSDSVVSDSINSQIQQILYDTKKSVNQSIIDTENGIGDFDFNTLETKLSQDLTSVREKTGKLVLDNLEHTNNLYAMVLGSESKGNVTNITQISACLGQQELTGTGYKRIGKLYNGRTLPYYCIDDDTPEARGFVSNSYLTGLNPQEFFFHMMAGRIGLIDTAVKTSDTGYIQRRLIKALEDIKITYDGTVRNANNGIIQFIYGDLGYDCVHFESQRIDILKMGNSDIKNNYILTDNEITNCNKIKNNSQTSSYIYDISTYNQYSKEINQIYLNKLIKSRDKIREYYLTYNYNESMLDDEYKVPFNLDRMINQYEPSNSSDLHPNYIINVLDNLFEDSTTFVTCVNTELVKSKKSIKSVAEKYSKLTIKTIIYTKLSPKKCIYSYKLSKQNFNTIVLELKKKLSKVIDPGEMVGIVAAQSIGEPSTQMTLNTFHSAGISSKGTGSIGLPRLRELMANSKNAATKIMTIVLDKEHRYDEEYANQIKLYAEEIKLNTIYTKLDIYYDPDLVYIEKDNVDNLYYVNNVNLKKCNENITKMNWLIRIELNKNILLDKHLTLFQIRSKFCKFINDSKLVLKKDQKSVIEKMNSCAILTNYDNDIIPIIHIRLELNKFTMSDIINIKNIFLEKLQFRGIPQITDAGVFKNKEIVFTDDNKYIDEPASYYNINTFGINFEEILQLKGVNSEKTYCNDIFTTYNTFGIEAARTLLLKEYREIGEAHEFKSINYAHLSLLVDFMCQPGYIVSIDRYGINKLPTDPLTRASFEETTDQIMTAALFGEVNSMNGISSNIMTGQVIKAGTGMSKILVDLDMLENHFNKSEFKIKTNTLLDIKSDSMIDNVLNGKLENVFYPV